MVPIRTDGSKGASVKWKAYQKRKPRQEELEAWFRHSNSGIGIIGGKVSGNLEVLDFDEPGFHERWKEQVKQEENGEAILGKLDLVVATPGGGHHVYYRCDTEVESGQKLAVREVNSNGIRKTITLIETRAEGNYVIHPISPVTCHERKLPYLKVSGDFRTIPLLCGEEREIILAAARALTESVSHVPHDPETSKKRTDRFDLFNAGTSWPEILSPHGWTQTGTSAEICRWARSGKTGGCSATTNVGGSDLLYVFSTNAHPFQANKAYTKLGAYALLNHGGNFRAAIQELAKKGLVPESDTPRTQSEDLIALVETKVVAFHTPDCEAFVSFEARGHQETWSTKSRQYLRWLTRQFYEVQRRAPSRQALEGCIAWSEAKALFDGPELPVYTRIAGLGDSIVIDLADVDWKCVVIDKNGWRVEAESPVKFRRTSGMLPLPAPQPGGSIEELYSLLNIGSRSSWVLRVAWLLAALKPDGPYPALVLCGEQGSAKSWESKVLRGLIDPAKAVSRSLSREERDLMISARNSWVLAFDNLSTLPDWCSDAFCRLATGGGFSTRKLYTDDEEELFESTRPILFNGIVQVATRADLVDRTLIIDLPEIEQRNRVPESELKERLHSARPRIIGALLDAVAEGLRNCKDVQIRGLPRMADFARWVVACEPALPFKKGEFLAAYQENRLDAIETTLEADPLATAIRSFMACRSRWEGEPQQLYEELSKTAGEKITRTNYWPGAPNWLTRRLKRPITFLRSVGIHISFPTRGRCRHIVIVNSDLNDDVTDGTDVEASDEDEVDNRGDRVGNVVNVGKTRDLPGGIIFGDPRWVQDLIQTADDLERGIADKTLPAEHRKGLQATLQNYRKTLSAKGIAVVPIEPGDRFDPHKAEAIGTSPTNDESVDDRIKEVVTAGYFSRGKLLRPAKVIVWKYQLAKNRVCKRKGKATQKRFRAGKR